jgi:hypothetical protein
MKPQIHAPSPITYQPPALSARDRNLKSTPAPEELLQHSAVASRAYTLWEKAGRPPGQDQEYWFKAEHELYQSTSGRSFTES